MEQNQQDYIIEHVLWAAGVQLQFDEGGVFSLKSHVVMLFLYLPNQFKVFSIFLFYYK